MKIHKRNPIVIDNTTMAGVSWRLDYEPQIPEPYEDRYFWEEDEDDVCK